MKNLADRREREGDSKRNTGPVHPIQFSRPIPMYREKDYLNVGRVL